MTCNQCPQSCHGKKQSQLSRFLSKLLNKKKSTPPRLTPMPRIALVGMPNVGKSVLFNVLTGTYMTVSNYPGTTVEVAWGETLIGNKTMAVVDTPGMYSLSPITEEERVARDLLIKESVDVVIHVMDAKNLGRMLPLTLQLIEAKLPVILVLNMIDEVQQLGIEIAREELETTLNIPVVMTATAKGYGVEKLKNQVQNYVNTAYLSPTY
ncbi:MAG: FeoB small GTPase domain-containing protein [Crocosphaera sp.]|nr:FeoB small GTPase domain-containing protein [Crocosphaera sp.]